MFQSPILCGFFMPILPLMHKEDAQNKFWRRCLAEEFHKHGTAGSQQGAKLLVVLGPPKPGRLYVPGHEMNSPTVLLCARLSTAGRWDLGSMVSGFDDSGFQALLDWWAPRHHKQAGGSVSLRRFRSVR